MSGLTKECFEEFKEKRKSFLFLYPIEFFVIPILIQTDFDSDCFPFQFISSLSPSFSVKIVLHITYAREE